MLTDDLLNGAAAAKFLNVPRAKVYKMVENQTIPFIRKGRSIFFRKSELEQSFRSEVA